MKFSFALSAVPRRRLHSMWVLITVEMYSIIKSGEVACRSGSNILSKVSHDGVFSKWGMLMELRGYYSLSVSEFNWLGRFFRQPSKRDLIARFCRPTFQIKESKKDLKTLTGRWLNHIIVALTVITRAHYWIRLKHDFIFGFSASL